MRLLITLFILQFTIMNQAISQSQDSNPAKDREDLPYRQIPDYPDSYTPETVAARMVDGLGYRYYWATESLRVEDLAYRPSEDSRTTGETIDHIYGLSRTIVNAPQSKVNSRANEDLTFEEKRKRTLENFEKTSKLLKEGDIEDFKIIFQREGNTVEFPFWNMINGPIEDAIYHTGQVVAYRRASGNPIHPGVSVFSGKTVE